MKVVGISVLVLNIALVYTLKKAPYKVFGIPNQSQYYPHSRIYNGFPAKEDQFQFMIFTLIIVSPTKAGRCSSSLIEPNWVLIAAHCLNIPEITLDSIFLVGGNTNLFEYVQVKRQNKRIPIDEKEFGVQERQAKQIFIHPHFDPDEFSHDIALILLEKPFTLSSIKTIPLSKEKMVRQMSCTVLGWGLTNVDFNNFKLNYIENKVVTTTDFDCYYRSSGPFICLKSQESGICQGDSGGPLVCDGKVWGVASHFFFDEDSESCGESLEDYYAEVYPDLDWLYERFNRGNPSVVINLKSMLVLSGLWLFLKSWVDIY